MEKFMKTGGWDFPVMMDSGDIATAYKVQAVPTVFVVDSDGRLIDRLVGKATAQKLSRRVADLLS